MKLKILHISNDEKFIDSAIKMFSLNADSENVFLLPTAGLDKLKFVRSKEKSIETHPYLSSSYFELIHNFNPDILFVHGLSPKHIELLRKLNGKYRVYLYSWGADIFSLKKLNHLMMKPVSQSLWDQCHIRERGRLKNVLSKIKQRRRANTKHIVLKSIQYMGTVIQQDFKILQSHYQKETSHIKYLPFNYSGFVSSNDMLIANFSTGENVLLGNSASPVCCHSEAFEVLEKVNLTNKRVIVPLSYGGNKSYVQAIIEKGNSQLGDNFQPLVDFLDKETYESILGSVGYAIMPQIRQHAMGNILYLLSSGVTVYMDKKNPAYDFLIDEGFIIKTLQDLERFSFEKLEKDQMILNRRLTFDLFGDEALQNKTNNLVRQLALDLKHT
jgi:hypothetical protein